MKLKKDIWRYLSTYLNQSRNRDKDGENEVEFHIPPTSKEIQDLISYLKNKGIDPIIVGSVAVISHLNLTEDDFRSESLRTTKDLDLFVSQKPPQPPPGWSRDTASIGLVSWISPTGGYVDFLVAGHRFPDNHKNPLTLGKDPVSESMGCPVADLVSLFILKLNSHRAKDLEDLVNLAQYLGIPKGLERKLSTAQQKENLDVVKLWLLSSKE